MTDNEALLQAICADPDNVTLRLIYADWLEEHGDAARAEFIRVQCQLADMDEYDDGWPELRERELALLNRHGRGWWKDIAGVNVGFRRGFVERLKMPVETFLRLGEQLVLGGPPVVVDLTGRVSDYLQQMPCLARLRGLRISDQAFLLDGLRELAAVNFVALRELGLLGLGPAEVELLGQTQLGHQLVTLALIGISGVGLEFLAASRSFSRVRQLDLAGTHLSDSAVRGLAASPYWPALVELSFSGNGLTSESVDALSRSTREPALQTLDLSWCRVGIRGCKSLATAKAFSSLQRLRLESCALTAPMLAGLVQGPGHCWRQLDLGDNFVLDDDGVRILAQAPRLAELKCLNVGRCGTTPWGLKDVMWSPHLRGLKRLIISGRDYDERCWQVLNSCPIHQNLQALGIHCLEFPDKEMRAFGQQSRYPKLRSLKLSGPLKDEGLKTLAESEVFRQIVELDLIGTEVTPEGFEGLLWLPDSRLQVLRYPVVPSGQKIRQRTLRRLGERFFAQDHLV
jgi:uncharacterized protein (TIGR02996 family)